MPMNGCINDQESLIGLKNGYIEGLKKISKENIVMKHDLRVFVRKRVKKKREMGHLGDLEVTNKETEPKIGIYAKTKQDSPY